MSNVERRVVPATELRVANGDAGANDKRIVGHAALFNSLSEDLGGFREVIAPGAFKDAIMASDVRALFNHDPNFVLGRVKAGTLKVSEDERGLAIDNTPPDTQWARDLVTSMERGDIDQMSFGFRIAKGGDTWSTTNGQTLRTITKVEELLDVSPVTYPAYPETSVALRSLEAWRTATATEATTIVVPQQAEPAADEPGDSSLVNTIDSGVPLELLKLKLNLAEIE